MEIIVPATAPAVTDNGFIARAFAYLHDLESAAQAAKARRDQARLAYQDRDLPGPVSHAATDSLGGAMKSPTDVLDSRWNDLLATTRRRTESDAAYVADWYARAAVIACRAVLADEQINAAWLELKTRYRNADESIELDPSSPAFRPELPEIGELDTGDRDADAGVYETQRPLQAAYDAAVAADYWNAEKDRRAREADPSLGESARLSGWEADRAAKAAEQAARIPDLLIAWAAAVTNAADHAWRSRHDRLPRGCGVETGKGLTPAEAGPSEAA